MSIPVVDQMTLGIGRWTATQQLPLGFEHPVPPNDEHGPQLYRYVQYVKGSGPDAYRGTPCGYTTATVDGSFIVSGDENAVLGGQPVGVFANEADTAITTAYYGWIQVIRPGHVLKDVCLLTASAAGDHVYWAADCYLSTCSVFTATAAHIPWGVVLSGVTAGHVSSANQYTGDVMVNCGALGD